MVGRRKNTKCRTTDSSSCTNVASASDIVKYFVKQPDSDEADYNGTNASVPCPDAAALPCSTISGCACGEKDVCNICSNAAVELANDLKVKSIISVENASNSSAAVSKRKAKKPTLVVRNTQITDFFPVRRSSRKTSVLKITERNKIIEEAILCGKEECFEIKEFPDKGRGVITTKTIKRGEFVLEYYGELIDYDEAKRRESLYADKENIGCYMYYFKFKNKQYCIDATKETNRLGRLVNHSKKGNLKTRTFPIQESPHLVFFAGRDIQPGEELSYDYGDRRKAALDSHPWLAS